MRIGRRSEQGLWPCVGSLARGRLQEDRRSRPRPAQPRSTHSSSSAGARQGKGTTMTDKRARRIAEFIEPLRVKPGSKVTLAKDFDPAYKADFLNKKDGDQLLQQGVELLAEYQEPAGRAGHLRAAGVPAGPGCRRQGRHHPPCHERGEPAGRAHVSSFKVPSSEELDHDFLWRYAQRLPARGDIGIFNRSHYEEVLVVRVHPALLDRRSCPRRPRARTSGSVAIGRSTTGSASSPTTGIKVVKLFLNLSKEEQRIRFLSRIDLPEKNWKFSANDAKERQRSGTTTRRRSRRCCPTPAPSGRPGT